MKKIIIGIFSFAMLLMAQNVSAAVWNGASNDCPGISVANYTTNTGIVVPCWPLSTISANGGQVVNIRVYYHNTNTQSNTNTRVLLNAPTGASSSHTFSGQIVSDQGSISLGSIRVNTPSGTTLNFSGAHWLPNQRQTESSLLSGQTGAEILTGGLNIGTIAPGWDTQGSVVVVFNVTGPATPPATVPTGTLTPNKTSCAISAGANSCEINFSWNTNNPSVISAVTRDGGANVATGNSGTKAFTIPYNTATFRLYNSAIELDSETVTSYCTTGTSWNGSVCYPNLNPTDSCTITSFTVGGALSSTVTLGNGVELAWTTTGCNSVEIAGVGSSLNPSGSKTAYPTVSTTYRATAIGSSGAASPRTVSVIVNNGANPNYTCSISRFTVGGGSTASVFLGDSLELEWASTGCNYMSITEVGSSLLPNDNYTIYPNVSKTYRITGYGSSGSNPTRTVSVTVKPVANPTYTCSISNFTANSSRTATVVENNGVDISWNTSNCTSINIQGVGTDLYSSGSKVVYPNRNIRYTLVASGINGVIQTRYVDITVTRDVTPSYTCYIEDFSVSNSNIRAGESVRLNWDTDNCNNISISTLGTVYSSGNRLVYPAGSTSYVINAYGTNGGLQTRTVYVNVGAYINPIPTPVPTPVYNKCAVTTVATNINQTSAQLNGIITGTYGANTYFEYGTTVNLGTRTASRYVNSNTNFSDMITGLNSNTIYYFRMVSDCQNGISQGAIEVFRTNAIPKANVVTNTVVQGTTIIGTSSPVLLNISNRYQSISEGDLIDYVVTYKNIGKVLLMRPMVQVVLPTNVTLVNSSRGAYAVDTHTLSAQIEDLNPGQEGVIYLQGRVDSIPLNNSQIPTTAILIYTSSNGSQENAMAYVINVPRLMMVVETTNDLGASAFFAGLLSIGLIGWLLIILVILLLIFIVRSVYSRDSGSQNIHTPTH